jgi:hypothetical protein
MAEIAGLCLGVLGVISPLVDTSLQLCEVYFSASHLGEDVNALRY